jgi:glycerol-3-phosphate acyltransferase PlsY
MRGEIALILGAYLLGSAPHLQLLAKLRHIDVNGDFHQSLWDRGGPVIGTIGILGEFARGVIPVLLGRCLGFSLLIIALAGLAAVIGQMWPIFSKFDGERGNSIALAMAMALTPIVTLVALIPIVISLVVRTLPRLVRSAWASHREPIVGGCHSRSLPLGMAAAFLSLPFANWWLRGPLEITLVYSTLFLLIIVRRLTAGLRSDLRAGHDIRSVLMNRLLYDRAFRQKRETPDS